MMPRSLLAARHSIVMTVRREVREKPRSAAIREIVAVNGGDDDVAQAMCLGIIETP